MMTLFRNSLPATRAFTLVETLVAISVLTIVMIAPFYAIQQSLSASDAARDELIGNMLAQEGLEYADEIRDNNYLATYANSADTQSWLYGLDGTTYNGNTSANCLTNKCVVDPTANTVTVCAGGVCPVLYLSTANIYNQSQSGTPTRFTRYIQLKQTTPTSSIHEIEVVSTVTWTTDHKLYTTVVTDYLQNWLPQ